MILRKMLDVPEANLDHKVVYRAPDGEYYRLTKDISIDLEYKQVIIFCGVNTLENEQLTVRDLLDKVNEFGDFRLVLQTSNGIHRDPVMISESHYDRLVLKYEIFVSPSRY